MISSFYMSLRETGDLRFVKLLDDVDSDGKRTYQSIYLRILVTNNQYF